jgi:hypothetical protein
MMDAICVGKKDEINQSIKTSAQRPHPSISFSIRLMLIRI